MRIFIHNLNTYIGKALVKELRKDERGLNRIFGCQSAAGGAPADRAIKKLTTRDDPKKAKRMEDTIRNCSTVIIDLFNCSLEDLYFMISALKVDPTSNPPRITGEITDADGNRKDSITLIIISSVMVWANTQLEIPAEPPVEETEETGEQPAAVPDGEPDAAAAEAPTEEAEGAEEEPAPVADVPARPVVLTEASSDQRQPVAGSKYEQWLQMENLVRSCFSLEGSQVKCFIVGAGVLYGDGEDTFTQLFKDAWLGVQNHKIVSPGLNIIPTVHVRDVARLVRQVAYNQELNPAEKPYLLAVDKVDDPAEPTQANIIGGIVGEVNGPYDIRMVEPPPPPEPAQEGDAQVLEQDSLTEALSLNLTMEPSSLMLDEAFEWFCSGGLLKNIRKVAEEFCTDRQLRALRVLIAGPPSAGKTTLCKAVSEHFNMPHYEMPETAHGASKEDLDATRKQLCSEVCRYRGYVLDVGLAGFKEVDELFCSDFELPLEPEEEEANEAARAEAEANGEEPPGVEKKTERRLNEAGTALQPQAPGQVSTFVIVLQAPEALCRAYHKKRGAGKEDKFQNDIRIFAERNLVHGEMNFSDFFQDIVKIGVFNLPTGQSEEDLFESIRIYMESGQGRPFNYLKSEEEIAQEMLEAQSKQEEIKALKALDLERQETTNNSANNDAVHKRHDERLRIISEHEERRKKIEELPLRDYLMRYMVPNLTEGLIEMCKVMPENPTDYLANYLEEHAARELSES
jgi:adenylate kinase